MAYGTITRAKGLMLILSASDIHHFGMTGKTEVLSFTPQQFIGRSRMRIMACGTVSFLYGTMDNGVLQKALHFSMAFETEFLQGSKQNNFFIGPALTMAGITFSSLEGLMRLAAQKFLFD
jgi:hypothetical protein